MRLRAVAAAVLVAGFGLTFAVSPWQDELVSDVPLYRGYAELFLDGLVPYRDITFEYPPLAAPLMIVPGLVSVDLDDYRLAFAALTLGLAAAAALATAWLARLAGAGERSALLAVALAPLVTGALIRTHFDLAPVLCLVAGLAAVAAARPRTGFALLGVGGALKLFPLMAVPVAAAWLWGRGERRAAGEGVVTAALVAAAAVAAAVALSPAGAWDAVEYHAERPVQIESVPASLLNALEAVGGEAPEPIHSHRSDGLEHPAAAALGAAGLGLLGASLAWLTLAAARVRDVRGLALAGLGSAVAFAAFGKVLSPQFMLWLAPLAALAWAWRMRALAVTAAAAMAATLAWFPERYFDLVDRDTGPLVAVGIRNALVLGVLALVARELRGLLTESRAAARSTPPGRPAPLRSAQR